EYTQRFNELIRYSLDINGALVEKAKMNKYRYGLRGDIAHAVSLQQVRDFGDLIQKAYSAEATIEYARQEKESAYQQKRDSERFRLQLKVKNPPGKGKPCYKCGNYHKGEYMKGKEVC
ncbi:hypothetical protein A2U01_0040369, partial [Trifolium medium]|nr:hypothetical protein [Trifolium medium]